MKVGFQDKVLNSEHKFKDFVHARLTITGWVDLLVLQDSDFKIFYIVFFFLNLLWKKSDIYIGFQGL